jgi:hypothetical protein
MIGLPLRDWLHQKPCTNRRKRGRSRLHLETLEERCLLSTVTNLSDHDPGSLRDAIAITPSGPDVSRRQTFAVNLQRRRTRQPPSPQDAKNGLSRSHSRAYPQPHRLGHASRFTEG